MVVFFSGCNKPTIDTSNDEVMKTSIQKVKNSLASNKQKEFEKSIQILMFSQIDMKNIFANAFAGKTINNNQLLNDMKKSINGKTGLEVIAIAKNLKAKRDKKKKEAEEKRLETEKNYELSELEALQTKKLLYEKDKSELSKFKIISAKFTQELRNKYSSRTQPIIELVVKNETNFPISRAYFKGTLQSKDRSIPWLVEDFNYEISGGLEPQEKSTWRLAPNMFSKWGTVDNPKDAILTVEVEKLDAVNGKKLYSIRSFTDKDKERLGELEKKYK